MARRKPLYIALIAVLALLIGTTVFAAPYGKRSLHTGATGEDVAGLQQRLADLGYTPGPVDGVFGDKTREALLDFQADQGLVPDGMASKWTFRALDQSHAWETGYDYTVAPGDTLWGIARNHDTTMEDLVRLNGLEAETLYEGEVLRIPGKPPVVKLPPVPAPDPAPGTGSPAPAPSRTVLGYYAEDWQGDTGSLTSLRNSLGQVNLVVNFQLLLNGDGTISTREYPALMAEARTRGLPVQGLVHNLVGGRFDADLARTVLSDPGLRATAIENLVQAALAQGLSGINIDIENVPPTVRTGYTAFVREAAERLHQEGLKLTLSIPAKTYDDTTSPWSGAFDYQALGAYADQIMLMSYDEHSPGYVAGPIASIGWFEKVAAFAVSQIPREKVLMGIAGYGYDWVQGTTLATGVPAPRAASRAAEYGATIQWDDAAQVPYYTYVKQGQTHIVYYENSYSLATKLDVVNKYNVGGIGIWRLGLEDPGIWPVIAEKLK